MGYIFRKLSIQLLGNIQNRGERILGSKASPPAVFSLIPIIKGTCGHHHQARSYISRYKHIAHLVGIRQRDFPPDFPGKISLNKDYGWSYYVTVFRP